MKRILVTGANGYIGSHVVKTLLDLGFFVTAVDFNDSYIDERADFVSVDIFNLTDNLYETLLSPEVLIHLAWKDGFVHNSKSHIEFLPKHYDFIEYMVKNGVTNVNVMGSMHEVGYFEGAIDENTPTNPSSLYGISKNALRQSLGVLKNSTPFCLKWLRGFYICGDDLKNNSIFAKLIQKANEGAKEFPFTTGTNKYDFIDIEDLALEISLSSVGETVDGVINCCSGKPVSLAEKVESFITENNLDIKLKYGVFPDRPYDSKIIYGNSEKIKKVLQLSMKTFENNSEKIKVLFDKLA